MRAIQITEFGGPEVLVLRELSDPDPPDWQTILLATHPPTIERIGTAVAFERQR